MDKILEAYENTILNEGSAVLRVHNSVKELNSIRQKINQMMKNLEALDNDVGGTDMIDNVQRDHKKLTKALNEFVRSVAEVWPEYQKMKGWKK